MKFLTNIDLNKNELQNARLQNLATHPASPVEGLVYYNTTDKKYYGYYGAVEGWKDLGVELKDITTSNFATGVIDTDLSSVSANDDTIPSAKAVKTYCDSIIGATDAMVYKGVIDCSTNPNYPVGNKGDTYRISVAGKIGGVSGLNVEVGDMIICLTDGSVSGTNATVGTNWNIIQTNIDGAVVGGASSTDHAIARFDGATGKIIQNSLVTIDDSGSINIPSGQGYKINGTDINTAGTLTNVVYTSTNQTIAGTKTFSGIVNMSALTASYRLETDASKNIVSVAKGTADNKNFETSTANIKMNGTVSVGTSSNVARADHIHPSDQTKTSKYAQDLGDGVTTTFTIAHNLSSLDVVVNLRETTAPYNYVMTDIQVVDVNNIKLLFATAPTLNQYRVIVVG